MKLGIRRPAAALLSGALVAAAALVVTGGVAQASTNPPWPADPNQVGSITFFDASGTVVTGGNVTDAPFAAYAQATHPGRVAPANPQPGDIITDTKAGLFGAVPKSGQAAGAWPNEQLSGTTAFPNASAPAALAASSLPLVSLNSTDTKLSELIGDLPNTASDSYQGLYQLRIKTVAPGQPADATYDASTIRITGTGASATWAQVPADTATVLTATPGTGAPASTAVTLKATVTPAYAAGSVQFYDGMTPIGSPTATSGGVATVPTSTLALGSHTLSAQFTPTQAGSFSGSTSNDVSYLIGNPPTATTTTLAVTPASPAYHGSAVKLTGTVAPAAAGTIQFRDGTSLLKAVAVSGATASFSTATLSDATHQLSATFVPTDATAFSGSTSATKSYVVRVHATTTKLAASSKSLKKGKKLTLKATVSVSTAPGVVRFYDGSKLLATVKVVRGSASFSTTKLAVGSHALVAKFAPTSAASFTASASAKVVVKVAK